MAEAPEQSRELTSASSSDESSRRDRRARPSRPRRGGRSFPRRRMNPLAADGIVHVDYKDVPRLRRFLTDRGKIEPRRKTGLSAKHQRSLALAIKRARHLALLPYVDGVRDRRRDGRRDGRRDRRRRD